MPTGLASSEAVQAQQRDGFGGRRRSERASPERGRRGHGTVEATDVAGAALPGRHSLTRSGGRWSPIRLRVCQGLLVAVALRDVEADELSPALVLASHKSEIPAPFVRACG